MNEQIRLSSSDRDSVYSFDSVSTNERLLDRLDFDSESIISTDTYRSSTYSSHGLQGDKHGMNRTGASRSEPHEQQPWRTNSSSPSRGIALPQQPMNNLSAIRRMKDYTNPTDLGRANVVGRGHNGQRGVISNSNATGGSKDGPDCEKDDTTSSRPIFSCPNNANPQISDNTISLKDRGPPLDTSYAQTRTTGPMQPRLHNNARFLASHHAVDTGSVAMPGISSSRKITGDIVTSRSKSSIATTTNSTDSFTTSESHVPAGTSPYNELIDTPTAGMSLLSLNSTSEQTSSHVVTPLTRTDLKRQLQPHNTPIGPNARGKDREMDSNRSSSLNSYEYLPAHTFTPTENSADSVRGQRLQSQEISPESRTVISQELRAQGKHREASYQLQIAANEPFNNPKAMYLYALALKHGQGVKQNYNASLKWLCKCILTTSISGNNSQNGTDRMTLNSPIVISKLNKLPQQDLIQLVLANLKSFENSDGLENGQNPESLYNCFKNYNKSEVNRISAKNKSKSDVVALCYFELGIFLLNGLAGGSNQKADEANGITCLSKSAAMCNVDAMEQLGEVWATKTKFRKKDLNKAAAWLRSAEIFGAKSIGNSWIYKEKYLKSNSS
ncbi:hypothetical protein CANMA_001187 [Candida margitis]|uniref:uncharacterized protein n=1 Tax=Candida margitis TaxID=1775924 RepID=UPI002226DBCB|nr:uncharacterized protein CANMA_001187 [Candida margitis]KAI5969725.1 hypothetical protein CANMA_001187 [Candida margitis]